MAKRFLDFDPLSGITTWFDYDEQNDKSIIGYDHPDLQPALDYCQALANDPDYRAEGRKSGWNHLGFIPNVLIEKWRIEKGINVYNKDHMPAVLKLLDDEYKKLKTTTARHVRRG